MLVPVASPGLVGESFFTQTENHICGYVVTKLCNSLCVCHQKEHDRKKLHQAGLNLHYSVHLCNSVGVKLGLS